MRPVEIITAILLLSVVAACEAGPPWGGGSTPDDDEVVLDFGPTAAYDRRLIFLGPGGQLPTAAVFDFVALSDSLGIRRGIRSRFVDETGWRTLMDSGWEMAPMREPWRLVPHGPLKLIVTEAGDLGALVHRDSVTIRLQFDATMAEHSPDVGTQLVLRGARLTIEDTTIPGVLLDAQLGRNVNPALVTRDRTRTPSPGSASRTDTAPDAVVATDSAPPDAGAAADSLSPTPIARPGAEALLLDNAGHYTVLAAASGGALAWIRDGGRDDVRTGARLEPIAWSSAEEPGVQVPTAWRIVSAEGDLTGELTARSTDRVDLAGAGQREALAYAIVAGWVEEGTVRRDVFGVVRHVR